MGHSLLLAPFLVALACIPFALPFGGNLEYEYATVVGWLAVVLLPLVAVIAPRRLIQDAFDTTPPPRSALGFLGASNSKRILWMFFGAPAVLMVPGLLAFVSARCSCSRAGYTFWMLVQAVPAVWIGMGLFWLVLRFRFEGRGIGKCLAFTASFVLLVMVLGGVMLWFGPQKRLLNPVLGFLHGPIYDRWIPVDNGVLFTRLIHGFLGWCMALFAWRGFKKGIRPILVPTLFGCCLFAAWWMMGTFPSTGWGSEALNERLPKQIQRGIVTVHYESGDDVIERDMRVLVNEAAFHAEDLAKLLQIESPRPVQIYVYPTDEVKKTYFGGGATDVTDVWTPSIHITRVGVPHPTLRHEMVHAISSQFGWHGIGFHPNMIVTEGLAMALAPLDERRDLDESSAAILKSGRIKNIEELFLPTGFWSQSGGRAYTIAGSFLRFLLNNAGATAIREIYAGASVDYVTGQSLSAWLIRWRTFVESKFDPTHSIENEAMFRSPGVLRDLCPHTMADYHRPRSENIWSRLRQPPGWDPADVVVWKSSIAPRDLGAKVELWNERIKKMASDRAIDHRAVATWLEAVGRAQHTPPKTVEDLELAMMESDLLALIGRRMDSQKKLAGMVQSNHEHPPGEFIERQVLARLRVEEQFKEDAQAKDWRRYLGGWRTIPEKTPDEPWIASYLRMRRERNPSRDAVLANSLLPVDDMDPSFKVEWFKMIGGRLLSFEDYENAARMYRELLRAVSGGRQTYFTLQLRMIETINTQVKMDP